MPKFNDDYFDALTKDREENSRVLNKASLEGVENSVVEKYSDQAHFIYELLQNADDAKATKASFILEKKRLIFKHNGTRKFTISNPDTERVDRQTGALGDINAITSIGSSSKSDHKSYAIGKFGVGFKAVFQYTDTPHIYDQNICFKIEDFIVPQKLDHDYPTRKIDETVFVFPFNRASLSPENAYQEIKAKLENLDNPVLFLSNLKDVSYVTEDSEGFYRIERIESRTFALNTIAEKLKIHYGNTDDTKKIWLFSRNTDNKLRYSVGFWVNENDNFIPRPKDRAFCYFSTKVVTHLNFIIHAPFLLTDSREGIKASEEHNRNLIQQLAELAGDALLYFHEMDTPEHRYITEDILQLIPLDETLFTEVGDINEISFKPFYTEILKRFKTEELIPGKEHCVSSSHAYWASIHTIMELFSNEQLQQITGDPMAEWIFPSKGRDSLQRAKSSPQLNYIEALRRDYFDDNTILKKLKPQFIESQPVDWLLKFYKWCVENSNRRIEAMRLPIFLNQDRKAVMACTSNYNDSPKIFLPDDEMPEVESVHKDLIDNPEIKTILVESFQLRKPDKLDYIKNNIIDKHDRKQSDFVTIFKYYKGECTENKIELYLDLIKECPFVWYVKNGQIVWCKPSDAYILLDPDFNRYLKCAKLESIIDLNDYVNLICNYYNDEPSKIRDSLINFFKSLGTKTSMSYTQKTYSYSCDCSYNISHLLSEYKSAIRNFHDDDIPSQKSAKSSRYYDEWEYREIEGLRTYLSRFKDISNKEGLIADSLLLWKILLTNLEILENANCKYLWYVRNKRYHENFDSIHVYLLKTIPWLYSKDNKWIAVKRDNTFINTSDLSDQYDTTSPEGKALCEFLGIKDPPTISIPLNTNIVSPNTCQTANIQSELITQEEEIELLKKDNAAKDERIKELEAQKDAQSKKLEKYEQEEAERERKKEEKRQQAALRRRNAESHYTNNICSFDDQNDDSWEDCTDLDELYSLNPVLGEIVEEMHSTLLVNKPLVNDTTHPQSTTTSHSVCTVENRESSQSFNLKQPGQDIISQEIMQDDASDEVDDYLPAQINYDRQIYRTKRATIAKLNELNTKNQLLNNINSTSKYSYLWFKSLIELENLSADDTNKNSRNVSITFGKVERESNTERTLILSNPNIPIPQIIEELSDINILLLSRDKQYTVILEAASIRSFKLRVKIRDVSVLKDVDLSQICEVHIDAKSPAFLWSELLKGFESLSLSNSFNMQENLPENIEFIFGPPGTGKTTYLCENIIIPMMTRDKPCRMLILAPTNKAADVIVRRVMSLMKDDMSYRKWLVRFGTTSDDAIEQSGVFRDRVVDIESFERLVLVTTIARFPYDYFITNNKRIQISEMNWDQIVFDEASMIPAANIVYPLYKKKPDIFYIAGDPFQISPITSVNLWAGETIYTMTGLNSFSNPKTVPHNYKITSLKTQYRSIPEIGSIFSTFKYNGILEHNRTSESRKPLNIDLDVKSLNLIEFPVSRYESIYRCKRLNQSSNYQIYSAIFTYEFACYLARELCASAKNSREKFNIGIISPYRVQADLIGKLIMAEKLPESVDIQTGTIHSFQGDECDIIFAIFNPPEKISEKSFVNRDNIINVAISRARDYLFVIMPDMNTSGIENMHKVNHVKELMKQSCSLKVFQSNELEKIMFGDSSYIEENAFSTSHQSVNVYGEPERVYEIRSESTAIDIQVHRKSRTKPA